METNPEVTRTPYTCFLALALRSVCFVKVLRNQVRRHYAGRPPIGTRI